MNNNGIISFVKAVETFTPNPFPLADISPTIAPFWADVDTIGTGRVLYRQTSNPDLLERARDDISCVFEESFTPAFLFIATWDHVGYYRSRVDKVIASWLYILTAHRLIVIGK